MNQLVHVVLLITGNTQQSASTASAFLTHTFTDTHTHKHTTDRPSKPGEMMMFTMTDLFGFFPLFSESFLRRQERD